MSEPSHTRAPVSAVCVALLLTIATPPARAATPISACGTVIKTSGSYVVTQNLILKKGASEPCVTLASNYVAIDLRGFTIDCACGAREIGCPDAIAPMRGQSFTGIIVRNGQMTHCDTGLLHSATAVLIDELTAVANINGMDLASGGTIIRSIVNDNSDSAIDYNCPFNLLDSTLIDPSAIGIPSCTELNDLVETR